MYVSYMLYKPHKSHNFRDYQKSHRNASDSIKSKDVFNLNFLVAFFCPAFVASLLAVGSTLRHGIAGRWYFYTVCCTAVMI